MSLGIVKSGNVVTLFAQNSKSCDMLLQNSPNLGMVILGPFLKKNMSYIVTPYIPIVYDLTVEITPVAINCIKIGMAHHQDAQPTGEPFSPQKITSSTSKHENSLPFPYSWVFFPS
jgi:hypothetical protein